MLKNFFQSPWKTLQNQTISEYYTDDNKSKYYGNGNPKDLFKYAKKIEKVYTKETTSTAKFLLENY